MRYCREQNQKLLWLLSKFVAFPFCDVAKILREIRSTVWGWNSFISHPTDVKFTRIVHNNICNKTTMTVLSFIEFEKTPPGVQTGNDYAPIYALASIWIPSAKIFMHTQNSWIHMMVHYIFSMKVSNDQEWRYHRFETYDTIHSVSKVSLDSKSTLKIIESSCQSISFRQHQHLVYYIGE